MHPPSVTQEMARAFQEEQARWRVAWCYGAHVVKRNLKADGSREVDVFAFGNLTEAQQFCDLTSTMVGIAAAVKLAGGWDEALASVMSRPLPDAEMRSRMKTPVELP